MQCSLLQYPYHPYPNVFIYTTSCKAVNRVDHWLSGGVAGGGGGIAWETHAVVYHGGFSRVCAQDGMVVFHIHPRKRSRTLKYLEYLDIHTTVHSPD